MKKYHCVTLTVFFLVVPLLLFGADQKTTEGEALLAKAGELFDLRAESNRPFRLRARARFFEKGQYTGEGSYLLIWGGNQTWREEIVVPGFQQVLVGGPNKVWVQRNLDYKPLLAFNLVNEFSVKNSLILGPKESILDIKGVNDNGSDLRCLQVGADKASSRILCFDPVSGSLKGKTQIGAISKSYRYSDYANIEGQEYPRRITVYEGSILTVEVTVEEVVELPSLDSSLFVPPQRATESPGCFKPTPPKELLAPSPQYPEMLRMNRVAGVVLLSFEVGTDGRAHKVKVLRSAAPGLKATTVEAIKKDWRFEPAKCQGVSVPFDELLETNFRLF
jgi:TonB family protein